MSSFFSITPLLAQAASQMPAAPAAPLGPAAPWYQEPWFGFIVALAVIVLPFLVGQWWAKKLRMNDYAWRIGLLLFSLTAGIVICLVGWPPRLGIDLSGGVILVYEVDQSKTTSVNLPGVVDQVRKELEDNGLSATVTSNDDLGQVEVALPGVDPAETAKVEQQLSKVRLSDAELLVEARPIRGGQQVLVYGVRNTRAVDMDRLTSSISKRVNPGGQKEVTVRRMGTDRVEVIIPQAEPAEVDLIKDKISTAGAMQFRILANPAAPKHRKFIELADQTTGHDVKMPNAEGHDELVSQWVTVEPTEFPDIQREPPTVVRQNKKGEWERLVIVGPGDVDGHFLSRASPANDPQNGQPMVSFTVNSEGAGLFGDLTGSHLPDPNSSLKYQLGIVLDGKLMSAPYIQGRISNQGQISGSFTQDKVQFLVDILNAGSLPAALSKIPIAEYSASAQLGTDTIRAGAWSMGIATIAVLIFMQIYYRFCGVVANLAVLMNLVLIMAVMILIKAHLTLAGLAGLVLSVGMAVDANVLIYERMREEQERGAALRMAIRNGFGRAMATIIDSHCTTLITGIVLFAIGTDQLRGFATTLVLGLLLNLFTAVYCSRIIFDIAERQHWIKQLKMMHIFGKTNFDFVKWMPRWMAISVTTIVVGMGAAVAREAGWFGGAGLFGIDFTGGTAVQVVFNKPTEIKLVREKVTEAKLPDVSVSAVASNDPAEHDTHFNIDTSFQGETKTGDEKANTEAIKALKDKLKTVFAGQLKMYSMEIASVAAASPEGAETALPETKPESGSKDTAAKAAGAKDGSGKDTAAKDAAAKSNAQKTAAEKAAAEKSSADKSAAAAEAGTLAKLRFPDGINYTSLETILIEGRRAAGLPETVFDLSSPDPEYTPGSSITVKNWDVRVSLPHEQTEKLLSTVQQELADTPVFPSANNIGGKVAGDTETTAYYALGVSNILVAAYIWIRFQNLIFGMAAIVALIHDVFIAVGALALSYWLAGPLGFLQVDPFKISLEVVAALLTIVGYSINDTIVVFDRIREIRGKSPDLNAAMINQAVNQTLSRTILTSGTVFLVTFILYFFGGEGVHAFAFAMMIGVLTGTYSSVFIAAPILLWFKRPTATAKMPRKTAVNVVGATGTH
ncbi:MAG TPA: protein translocase subunit SecD [Pirellulales bacterium]|jgi:SecD/SecF fusion protein